MDAALIAEREAFKRRAMAVPTVENKKKKTEDSKKSSGSMKPPKGGSFKSFGAGSQYKFGVLAKIVRHMKHRHMEGEDHPLTLDEILDETNQLDISGATKQWLMLEALG
ncbi:transcription initiation factor IIE subunit beta, partial [Eurytemora carolleeae]|uniref:transcription initiation factor IIE subunit beta n=1 Tax=Eurytemora carolleeae TaxID=1294199 RepID=UPI000C7685B6